MNTVRRANMFTLPLEALGIIISMLTMDNLVKCIINVYITKECSY